MWYAQKRRLTIPQLAELEDKKEISIDVAQEILLLTRDIHAAYQKASFNLKRQYLGFFWERFDVQDGVILRTHPAPLFDALLKLEAAYYRECENTNHQETAQNGEVILSDVLSVQ